MTSLPRTSRRFRRDRLASVLAASLVAGCVGSIGGCSTSAASRVAWMNPFAKSNSAGAPSGESSSWFGGSKQSTGSAPSKLASWFGGDKSDDPEVQPGDPTDPTSLAHKAEVTPEVFVANGRLWESTGNFEKAMESYAKALEKNPNDADALSNIARLHFRLKNHQKAAEYFGQAIKQKPDDAGLYNDLGLTLSKLGNHSAAASTIEQALRLAPGTSRFANNLASVKFEADDIDGALEVLVQNNKPAVAHFNMAYLHYKHGRASDSQRHLNQALQFAPQSESDPATKRAVERSRELLAQIGAMPGQTKPTTPQAGPKAGPSVTAPSGGAIAAAAASRQADAETAGASQAVKQTGQTATPAAAGNDVRAAAADPTSVNFGKASYKRPPAANAPAQTATQSQPTAPAAAAPAAATPATAIPPRGTTPSSGRTPFALPPQTPAQD